MIVWGIVMTAWVVILAFAIFGQDERKDEARREGLDDL